MAFCHFIITNLCGRLFQYRAFEFFLPQCDVAAGGMSPPRQPGRPVLRCHPIIAQILFDVQLSARPTESGSGPTVGPLLHSDSGPQAISRSDLQWFLVGRLSQELGVFVDFEVLPGTDHVPGPPGGHREQDAGGGGPGEGGVAAGGGEDVGPHHELESESDQQGIQRPAAADANARATVVVHVGQPA